MEETSGQSDTVASDVKTRRRMPMEQREEVRRLLIEGMSRRQISKKMGVSSSVIWRLEKKLQETGTVQDRHGGGRPRVTHQPSEHWILLDGEHKFQCKHCEKLFVHHALLREHLRTHTGERPFKCDQCVQAFSTTSTLKRHLVKHTDNKPFMCDFCAKQFADNGSLRIHLRVHTGDKPYKCSYCDRRCITRGNLNAHMRIHRNLVKTLGGEDRGEGGRNKEKKVALLHDTSEDKNSGNANEMDQNDVMEKSIGNSVDDIMKEIINNESKYAVHGQSEINYHEGYIGPFSTTSICSNHGMSFGNYGNNETIHCRIAVNDGDSISMCSKEGDMQEYGINIHLDPNKH